MLVQWNSEGRLHSNYSYSRTYVCHVRVTKMHVQVLAVLFLLATVTKTGSGNKLIHRMAGHLLGSLWTAVDELLCSHLLACDTTQDSGFVTSTTISSSVVQLLRI
jgi:hypothetical protein